MSLLAWLPVWAFGLPTAIAQEGLDAHGFTLVAHDADPRDGLVLERPGALTPGRFFAGAVLEYAHRPLVLVDGETGAREPVIDALGALNTSAGLVVHERLRVDVGLPLYWAPDGVGRSAAAGDVRIASMIALIPADRSGFGLGVVPSLVLPTGASGRWLGERAASGGLALAATREWAGGGLTANLGALVLPEVSARNLKNTDRLTGGIGGHLALGARAGASLEVRGEVPLRAASVPGTAAPWEVVASARRGTDAGGFLTAGAAGALTGGAGAAAFRVFLGGGFGGAAWTRSAPVEIPAAPPPLLVRVLRDGAPVAGAAIQAGALELRSTEAQVPVPGAPAEIRATLGPCLSGRAEVAPGAAEVDVVLGPARDAAIAVEVLSSTGDPLPTASVELRAAEPGCAPASVWLDEAASGVARVGATTWTVRASAPGHRPFEGQARAAVGPIAVVRAVLEPEVVLERVRVVERGIELLEPIFFDTGKATIRPVSEGVLDDVLRALAATAGRGRVEVQGHTDDVGNDAANLALSQARAEAVVAWLVARGADPARLDARGYGESRPLAPNEGPEARQRNRRVEFVFEEGR